MKTELFINYATFWAIQIPILLFLAKDVNWSMWFIMTVAYHVGMFYFLKWLNKIT